MKRVSPLKHQPESSENNESDDQKNQKGEYQKGSDSQPAPPNDDQSPGEGENLKSKHIEPTVLLGELEHYDLDMDEILDVPYIKSNQQLVPFTKVAPEKKNSGVCSTVNGVSGKTCSTESTEPAGVTQFCVLSPVKGSQLRKTQPIVVDQHKHLTEELELSQPLAKCSSVHESEAQGKGFLCRTFVGPQTHKTGKTMPNCHLRTFHLQTAVAESKQLEELNMSWSRAGGPEERSEEVKKFKSILNIVKEGQISLLVSIIFFHKPHRIGEFCAVVCFAGKAYKVCILNHHLFYLVCSLEIWVSDLPKGRFSFLTQVCSKDEIQDC